MSDIQNVSITATETVPQPKPHTIYTIQVSTPTRSWTVSRRYNDFVALNAELVSSAGKEPPAGLPPKHPWSLTRSAYDEKIVRERRILLETYLRSILTHRDPRWRTSYTWSDFLSISQNTPSSSRPNPNSAPDDRSASTSTSQAPEHWTSSNWLTEQLAVQSLLRSARSALLKRDALASMGDAAGLRGASVDAKKMLREVESRVAGLEKALGGGPGKSLGEGEKRRREEMVENLKAERGNLQRMAETGVRTSLIRDPPGSASQSHQAQGMPGGAGGLFGPPPPPTGRVFGAQAKKAPEETSETRPLDDRGLLQLQQTKMDDQDGQLKELSRLLQRQRGMGEEIHREIGEQNDLLDEVEGEVGKVGGKLARTKRQMNKLG